MPSEPTEAQTISIEPLPEDGIEILRFPEHHTAMQDIFFTEAFEEQRVMMDVTEVTDAGPTEVRGEFMKVDLLEGLRARLDHLIGRALERDVVILPDDDVDITIEEEPTVDILEDDDVDVEVLDALTEWVQILETPDGELLLDITLEDDDDPVGVTILDEAAEEPQGVVLIEDGDIKAVPQVNLLTGRIRELLALPEGYHIPTENLQKLAEWVDSLLGELGDQREFNLAIRENILTNKPYPSIRRLNPGHMIDQRKFAEYGSLCVPASLMTIIAALEGHSHAMILEGRFLDLVKDIETYRTTTGSYYNIPSMETALHDQFPEFEFSSNFVWDEVFSAINEGNGALAISIFNDHMVSMIGHRVDSKGQVWFELANNLPGYFLNQNITDIDIPTFWVSADYFYANTKDPLASFSEYNTHHNNAILVKRKAPEADLDIQIE